MENRRDRECRVFDGERILPEPARRGGIYIRARSVLAAALIVCAALLAPRGISYVKNHLINDNYDGGEVILPETADEESEESTVEAPPEQERDDTAETLTEDQTAEESEMIKEEYVVKDLSLAERGDSYILNYTKLKPDTEGILEMGFGGGRYSYTERPVVLLMHTFATKEYYGFDAAEPLHSITQSVVAVGESISCELNRLGIPSVYCSAVHDPDNPYISAGETIKTMLDIYPSIEYVIDLSRMDEPDEEGRMVRALSPAGLGQIRISVSSEGVLTRDTLALALSLRRNLNTDGRRLCLPVVFTDSEYNAPMVPYYLRVDIGSKGNDVNEAIFAGKIFAEELAGLLKK